MGKDMGTGFIPPHGGYEDLHSYRKSLIVFLATYHLVKRWVRMGSRTRDYSSHMSHPIALRLAAQPTKGCAVKPENYTDLPEELVQQTAPCFREREEAARGL